MQVFRQFTTWFSKQKPGEKLFIGCSGVFILFACTVFSPTTSTPEVKNTIVPEVVSTTIGIETAKPTNIPQITSTNTPEPSTPIPSATETADPYIYLFEVSSLVFLESV